MKKPRQMRGKQKGPRSRDPSKVILSVRRQGCQKTSMANAATSRAALKGFSDEDVPRKLVRLLQGLSRLSKRLAQAPPASSIAACSARAPTLELGLEREKAARPIFVGRAAHHF
jgi:hypothetical protein